MKIGIALGGGGARGVAHLGVLKALEEMGIKPDVISGASAGSIVGAFIAAGMGAEEAFDLIKDDRFLDYAKIHIPVTGLFSLDKFEKNLEKTLPVSNFDELEIPLYVAVSNLNSGKVEYLEKGSLIQAVKASSSIPVLFSAVEIDGNMYVDGGLLDNLPYKPLLDKCDKVIAVDIFRSELNDKLDSLYDIAVRTFELSVSINREEARNDCTVLIEPEGLGDINILDNSDGGRIFELGYKSCMGMKDKIIQSIG